MGQFNFTITGEGGQVCLTSGKGTYLVMRKSNGQAVDMVVNNRTLTVSPQNTCVMIPYSGEYCIYWAEQDCCPVTEAPQFEAKSSYGLIEAIESLEQQVNDNCNSSWLSTPTGLIHEPTGQPIYQETLYDGCGEAQDSRYFYFDTLSGNKIMTTTGFSKSERTSTTDRMVYETLASGVVEKLTQYVQVIDGVPQPATYTQVGGAAYTVVDATRVEPKPIKVQMGSEDLTVTGASTALAAIPTAANSEGENFPQHALIHVHVDSQDNAYGIAYTTDGTAPSEAHEFERSEGQPIELDTWEEINNFRAAPLDSQGDLATGESIEITVEYNNISPDKDDV